MDIITYAILKKSKADLVNGKVPVEQLPSYVSDVIEVATKSALPTVGEAGKIYITLDTNQTYRWSGSTYVLIGAAEIPLTSVDKQVLVSTATPGQLVWSNDFAKKTEAAAAGTYTTADGGAGSTGEAGVATINFNNATFTGTAATITIGGDVTGAEVGDHAAQTLTISGAQAIADHNHAVNAATASVTVVTGVNDAAFAGAHTHDVDSHAHGDDVTANKVTAYTAPSMTTISFTANTTQSLTAKNYGFSASQADIMTSPTVSATGVLSWTAVSASSQDVLSEGSAASLTGGVFDAGTFTYSTVTAAGAGSAATLTAASAGAHTHTVGASGTTAVVYVTGATLSAAGAATISGENFSAALPTLTHSVTQGSFTGSTIYTPAGSISGSQTLSAHTHTISNHTHGITIPNCAAQT